MVSTPAAARAVIRPAPPEPGASSRRRRHESWAFWTSSRTTTLGVEYRCSPSTDSSPGKLTCVLCNSIIALVPRGSRADDSAAGGAALRQGRVVLGCGVLGATLAALGGGGGGGAGRAGGSPDPARQ